MDEKSLEILEFPEIRRIISEYTSFPVSKDIILNLKPICDYDEISLLLAQSTEAQFILSVESGFDISEASDIRKEVKQAALGKILEPKTLIGIKQTLSVAWHVRSSINEISKEVKLIWDIAKKIENLSNIESKIARCISPKGEVLDKASPELSAIRSQLKETRTILIKRLESILSTPRGRKIMQEPIIRERHGRYVVPVKVEFRKVMKGITHDVSNTGASVYVEPWSTVDLGNTLRELQTEEKREIERILRNLSMAVSEKEMEILENVSRLAELDLIMAKARYARSVGAVAPELINSSDDIDKKKSSISIKLIDARHPLLGHKAVPLSVEIGKDFSILVITGPNTGGKTVALKTIGLLSLMTQSGIPIPASPKTRMPIFDNIFADIGDEQSIAQTLSSFSWHVGNIVRIIKNATKRSLVLLDELGTSTDPAEGSALACAVLLHFLPIKTLTVATTHYADLKAFAHTTTGIQNASFEFDPVSLVPTYHMTVGIPGGSNAIAVAEKLGIPPKIIKKAMSMISKGSLDLESMLSDIAIEKAKAKEMRINIERAKSEAQAHNIEIESLLEKIKSEECKIIQDARDDIVVEVANLHQQIRRASLDLRKERKREVIDKAKRSLTNVNTQLESKLQLSKVVKPQSQSPIAVGDTVYVSKLNIYGKVLSISKKKEEFEVQVGQITLKLKIESIEKAPSEAAIQTEAIRMTVLPKGRQILSKLDLRGKRADEVEVILDGYLNDATLSNLSEVHIVHGIGTGTVRQIVRDFLIHHPLVKSFSTGDKEQGGEGVTLVSL